MSRYLRMSAALAILAMAQAGPAVAQAPRAPSPASGPTPATPARKLTGKSLRRMEKRERRATTPKDRHEQ